MLASNQDLTEAAALILLNGLPRIGPILCCRLLARFGGRAQRIFQASRMELLSVRSSLRRMLWALWKKILACFAKKEGLKLSEIANLSGESIAQVNVTVVQLELKHCLSKNMDGRYEAKIG